MAQQADAPIHPTAWRGRMLHALDRGRCEYWADGGLLVNDEGLIEACGDWRALEGGSVFQQYARGEFEGELEIVELPATSLLMPGMIDLHTHLPQLDAIGRPADDLLSWLALHIYPAEAKLADPVFAGDISERFFKALLANGTTTAAVFLTSHRQAVEIAFETAEALGNRVIMGLNLMDSGPPTTMRAPESFSRKGISGDNSISGEADSSGMRVEGLQDGEEGTQGVESALMLFRPAEALLRDTEALCQRWHNAAGGRLQYAWMPRFAPACSDELLAGIGGLRHRYPDVYLHTHIAEQTGEIAEVKRQFPWAEDYTAVYERFHLLKDRTILAHGVHLSNDELTRLQHADCSLAHCPGSNFFLKSGRFRLLEVLGRDMRLGLGTDVGAGPDLSLFHAMRDAQSMPIDTEVSLATLFYLATLGGAEALGMADRIGNFTPGKAADFLIVNASALQNIGGELKSGALLNPSGELRAHFTSARGAQEGCEPIINPDALLAGLVCLGDASMVDAVFINGRKVHEKAL